MNRQRVHTDWAFLPQGDFSQRPDIELGADIELASSLIKHYLDTLACFFMLLPVFVLTVLVAIPNALAGPALHEGIAFLSACRTQIGRGGPIFIGVGGFVIIILPFS